MMKVTRRAHQRIPIHLETEFVSNKACCLGLIENISECGICVKIACIERIENIKPGTTVDLKFPFPSGQFLHLKCKKIWSIKNVSSSLIEHIGLEILDPPKEYKYFYLSVRFSKH